MCFSRTRFPADVALAHGFLCQLEQSDWGTRIAEGHEKDGCCAASFQISILGECLYRPAALDDTNQNDDEGHNEKEVNEPSQCVGSDESQEPQNQ